MLLSRSSQYAISGVVRLAVLPPDGYRRVEDLLAETDAPPHAVAKIFCELARRGVLVSVRGSGGGFRLSEQTLGLSLMQIVEAVDGPWTSDVIAPRGMCVPGQSCPLSSVLQPIASELERLLRTTTIADLIRDCPQTAACCPNDSGCDCGSSKPKSSPPFAENSHEHESTRVRQKGTRRGQRNGRR